jgi:hypothetical protein
MTEKHLLNAIEHMEFHHLPVEVLENMVYSLDFIIDNNVFPGELQEAAFCRMTELKEFITTRRKLEEEQVHEKNMQELALTHWRKLLNKEDEEEENDGVFAPSNEQEEIIRLMIRSEEEGTLRFKFRGLIWEWNHNTNSWDFHPEN